MNPTMASTIQHLSDEQLVATLTQLCEHERRATVALLAHLAEFDARRLYLGLGFTSLFAYCTSALRLSEHAAYNRIDAARVARRFPLVLELLAAGSINLTTVRLLAPRLTADNHEALLARASGKSRLQVEELVAECFPQAPIPDSVRKLPARAPAAGLFLTPASEPRRDEADLFAASSPTMPEPTVPQRSASVAETAGAAPLPSHVARRPVLQPLSSDHYKITFTARAETWRKLRQAQELIRHQVPTGDLADVIDRALSALLEQLSRRKFAAIVSGRPAQARPATERSARGRHIPAAVRREVWERDQARCAFVAASGRRCGERAFLEFHHVSPYAIDGPATTANLSLRCRAHNGHEAEVYFGTCRRVAALGPPS
jgi:hypothetical protein